MALTDISRDGRFAVLAIDHRDSLRAFLAPGDPDSLSADDLTALKAHIVRIVSPDATGAMLEPEYSIPQMLDSGALAPGVGFVAALEAQGYLGDPGAGPTTVLDGWSAQLAADAGAAAAKLLLPYVPGTAHAVEQDAVARDVLAQCHDAGLPLVLEPLFYGPIDPPERPRIVLETVAAFADIGADLLKLPFPVDLSVNPDDDHAKATCRSISAMVPCPWTVLSGGGAFSTFERQIALAMGEGCSGFMVGRALWGVAARAAEEDRDEILRGVVVPRFRRLRALVES